MSCTSTTTVSPLASSAVSSARTIRVADAAKRCKNPRDWNELAKAIRETKGVKTITGTIDLTTSDRTPLKEIVIVKVEGGLKYQASIKPQS